MCVLRWPFRKVRGRHSTIVVEGGRRHALPRAPLPMAMAIALHSGAALAARLEYRSLQSGHRPASRRSHGRYAAAERAEAARLLTLRRPTRMGRGTVRMGAAAPLRRQPPLSHRADRVAAGPRRADRRAERYSP